MPKQKSILNKITVLGGVAALCASVLVPMTANAATTTDASTVSENSISERRAEEIFLALYFMQGEEALSLYEHGEIAQLDGFRAAYDSVNTPEALKFSASVVAELRADEPTYFERFAKAITSGDPFVVEDQIAQGRADISASETVVGLAEEDTTTYVPGEIGPTCGVTVVVGAAFVLVAAAFAAAVAVLWAAVAAGQAAAVAETAVKVRNVKSKPQGDRMYQDWVADVTATYASK